MRGALGGAALGTVGHVVRTPLENEKARRERRTLGRALF